MGCITVDGIAFHTPDYDGNASLVCRRLALPSFLWAYFNGAYGELLEHENWLQFGDMPIDDVVTAFLNAFDEMSECYMIGSIIPFTRAILPVNVLLCDGSTHQRADFPLLYDVLPGFLVVNVDEFRTPDLRGRFLLGEGPGRAAGDTGGEENHTLTIAEMPSHTHNYMSAFESVTTIAVPDAPAAIPSPAITSPEGGGLPHNNMPPFCVVQYGIVAK